jgi:hypothetical protein
MRERLTYRRDNIAAAHLSLPLHHQQERHVIDNPRLKETASRSNENFGWIRRSCRKTRKARVTCAAGGSVYEIPQRGRRQ